MAISATTLTELNDLAKDYYSEVYVQAHNPNTPTKSQFSSLEGAQFTGRKWIFAVNTAVGGGAANSGKNKKLPNPDEGQYDQGEANVVRTYVRMALDGLVIEVTKRREGSYRPALAETMKDRLQAMDLEINRQLFCAGNGQVALIPTGTKANSATQTLEKDYGVTGGGKGARHVRVGDQVWFYKGDGTLIAGPRTVLSTNVSASTVTVDSAVDTTAADAGGQHFITKGTDDGNNFLDGEANGLLVAVKDSGTFENIPGTSYTWQAVRKHNSAVTRPLTDALLLETVTELRTATGLVPDVAITRPGVTLKFSEQFLPLRQIMGQDVQLKGGYKPVNGITHAGGVIPVLEDPDCPDGRIFLLNTGSFRMADLIGTEWMDMDGAQFTRITDKDGIEGYVRKYWNLITIQRNANAVIEDLEDISTIDRVK